MRQRYADTDHDSGVDSFEINGNSITVWFKSRQTPYIYSYLSAGKYHIEQMKILATNGDGLNAYIKKYVNNKYER